MKEICLELKNNLEENPKESDVIEWFHQQTNDGKSFLIVFDKFERIAQTEVIKQMYEFIVKLINKTKLMKIIILTTKEEFLNANNDRWIKKIECKPFSKELLANIM